MGSGDFNGIGPRDFQGFVLYKVSNCLIWVSLKMESVGFNDLDFAVIKEGLESIVEKKVEERRDVLCTAYEELDRVKSLMLKGRDSEIATLRSNLLELEMKFGSARREVERLSDEFQLREAQLWRRLDSGVALLERAQANIRRLVAWKTEARRKMKDMEDEILRFKRFAMDVGMVMKRRRSSFCL